MFSKLVLLSVLILCFFSQAKSNSDNAVVQDCGSVSGSIVKVEVGGCENLDRCPFKKGTNVTLTASFKSNVNSKALKAVVYGHIGPIKTKFNLPNPDACISGVACPIKPDETYTYTLSIFIKASYPRLNVDVQFELRDDDGKDVICALIPAKIVSKSSIN